MDGRITQYTPFAILAGPFLWAAMTIQRDARKSVLDPNTSAASNMGHWKNENDGWSVDVPDVNKTVSLASTLVTCIVLLLAISPVLIMTVVCALFAANELRLHVVTSPIWKSMTRPVLILLFSGAVWAAIKPQGWFDRCALVLLLLLLALNMMKRRVLASHRHVWNIIVYAVLVVSLLLAFWAMAPLRYQVCCRNICNITVYLVPVLLLLLSLIMKKLWTGAPRRRFLDIIVCTGLVALLFLLLWAVQAAQSQACYPQKSGPKVYCVPMVLLIAVWVVIQLSTWAPRRRIWNITRFAVVLLVLLRFVWMMKKLHTQLLCCSVWNQAVYLILVVSSLLTPWLTQGLRVRTHLGRLLDFVVWTVLLPVRFITLQPRPVQYAVQGVEPAIERPALLPSPISEEEPTRSHQDRQMKRLLALAKLHKVFFDLFRRTSAAQKTRLQHELAQARRDANAATSKAVAEYGELTASTREALDPKGIYRSGESIQCVVRRIKDRMSQQRKELEYMKALEGSSIVEAAVEAAKKEAGNQLRSLKTKHEKELSKLNNQAAAQEEELEKLAAAKSEADQLSQAEKGELEKRYSDQKAALQKEVDDKEAALRKGATDTEDLKTTVREKKSQLTNLGTQLTELRKREHDQNSRIQELNDLQEASKASAATHTEELTAVKSRADRLVTQADLAKDRLEAKLRKTIEDLESKLSVAASASTTEVNDRAVEEQRLKEEHSAAMIVVEAEVQKTLKQAASDMEQMRKAHVDAIAAKAREIQLLQKHRVEVAAQENGLQPSLDDMDIDCNAEPELQRKTDQIMTLSNDLAAERDHARGLAQEIEGLQQQQQNTLEEGRAAIKGLEDNLGLAKQKIEELTGTIRSGYQEVEAMNNTLHSNDRRLEELERIIQTKNQELKEAKDELLEADTEAVCQNDNVDMANEEKRKVQELSQTQQRNLEAQQAMIKELRDDLKKKEDMLKVTATEHNPSEYQAIYADLGRANDLLDEISFAGCDHTAQMVLEALRIANGTFLKVTLVLKEMESADDNDEAWASIHTELSEAIVGEHLLLSLSITNNSSESGHPTLLMQAQMANVRLRRLIQIVEKTDAKSKKNHILSVMVLPRGDEGNEKEGQGPDSGSSGDVDGATASKRRRSDGGIYSRPSESSSRLTSKQASRSSGSTSTKTPSGQQPSTFTTGSGFQLDPDHIFGFSYERPDVVEQRPPPEQRIFHFSTDSTQPPPQSAQQFAGEDSGMDKSEIEYQALGGDTAFDELNFADEVWNNATEDDAIDPRAGLGAAENFESPATPLNLLGDAGEGSFEASLTAEELRTQQLLRLMGEIDTEDSNAGVGLYEQLPDSLEDQEYHAMVDSAYGSHIPSSGDTYANLGDDGVAWEHAMPGNEVVDSDFDSAWPEGPAADLSEEGDPFIEQRASNMILDPISGRKIRKPRPTGYNPHQALIDWSKVSLTDTYMARKSQRTQSSGSGLGDSTESATPTNNLQTPRSPLNSPPNSEDESEAGAPQNPHSVGDIPVATASTDQSPPREYNDSQEASPFSLAYPPQSRKRTKFQG